MPDFLVTLPWELVIMILMTVIIMLVIMAINIVIVLVWPPKHPLIVGRRTKVVVG